jgi:hypothetical protein
MKSGSTPFFQLFPHSKVSILNELPQQGPDGFPYLLVDCKPDSTEPVAQVLSFASTKGIGLAVNPTKVYPDYIFTFGMLWNFRANGRFANEAKIQAKKVLDIPEGQKLLAGPPHPSYLPDDVRQLLRQFLIEQGAFQPRILVVGVNGEFDLCFSLESLGTPPTKEHEGILQALSWFLPPDYRLALISEKGLPAFIEL